MCDVHAFWRLSLQLQADLLCFPLSASHRQPPLHSGVRRDAMHRPRWDSSVSLVGRGGSTSPVSGRSVAAAASAASTDRPSAATAAADRKQIAQLKEQLARVERVSQQHEAKCGVLHASLTSARESAAQLQQRADVQQMHLAHCTHKLNEAKEEAEVRHDTRVRLLWRAPH